MFASVLYAVWVPVPAAATRVTAARPIIPAYVALNAPSVTILPPPAIWWPRDAVPVVAKPTSSPGIVESTAAASAPVLNLATPTSSPATKNAVTVLPEPARVVTVSPASGDIDAWLAASTVPPEWWPQFRAVSYCESGWHPGSVNGHGDVGLLQLEAATWAPFAGVSEDALFDPVTNLDVGWLVVQYDLARGYSAFSQWSCAYVLK